jgi:hypothetical protein
VLDNTYANRRINRLDRSIDIALSVLTGRVCCPNNHLNILRICFIMRVMKLIDSIRHAFNAAQVGHPSALIWCDEERAIT